VIAVNIFGELKFGELKFGELKFGKMKGTDIIHCVDLFIYVLNKLTLYQI